MPKLIVSRLGIDRRKAQDELDLFLSGLTIDDVRKKRYSYLKHAYWYGKHCRVLHKRKLKTPTIACYDLADYRMSLTRRILSEECTWCEESSIFSPDVMISNSRHFPAHI
ncbi:hypothetical protein BDQ12DRAFT_338030 [Crucibulum laeve]|uniref:Uncharacterized protein n=1 Tax=Crucibulum laeve TaxID=68775 RepID=A0A5C3M1A0_9AGAR|nr:hypothetical protein BDQ12DRAFT_338030 [Crucibulum laeve]